MVKSDWLPFKRFSKRKTVRTTYT